MCTYVTGQVPVSGSAASTDGSWFSLERAVVYFDHPQDAPLDHALCIDFRREGGSVDRVAVELDAESARSLATAILSMLEDDEVRPLLARPS